MVMDRSKANIGTDIFDTYAPVIDYSTIQLLIKFSIQRLYEFRKSHIQKQ